MLPTLRSLATAALALVALVAPVSAPRAADPPKLDQAVFAGGCFWCMEHDMGGIKGVVKVESGYAGGHTPNPTYADVTSETTGHYEVVRVTFDPATISYRRLLDRYWRLTDPTDLGGQFCDRGPSYRPAIFVTPAQRADAEASKADLVASGRVAGEVKTPILPLGPFTLAEEYHRDFAKRNQARYERYRSGCGRDARLKQVWKPVE